MISPVLTKADFVKRYEAGEFGNRSPTWSNIAEFLKEPHRSDQLIHIRNRVKGGMTWYDIPVNAVDMVYRSIIEDGLARIEDLYFSYMAPTDKTVIQGEIFVNHEGLNLFFSYEKKPMREALKKGRNTKGLYAKTLLRHFLPNEDIELIDYLLEFYEDHVIEFSTYSVPFGTLLRRTVIWEVRKY